MNCERARDFPVTSYWLILTSVFEISCDWMSSMPWSSLSSLMSSWSPAKMFTIDGSFVVGSCAFISGLSLRISMLLLDDERSSIPRSIARLFMDEWWLMIDISAFLLTRGGSISSFSLASSSRSTRLFFKLRL